MTNGQSRSKLGVRLGVQFGLQFGLKLGIKLGVKIPHNVYFSYVNNSMNFHTLCQFHKLYKCGYLCLARLL